MVGQEMSKVGWVVQTNLGKGSYVEAIEAACAERGYDYYPIVSIPFSDDLPNVPTEAPLIFYGSCNFVEKIRAARKWDMCYPSSSFDVEKWTAAYGNVALNSDASTWALAMAPYFFDKWHVDYLFLKPAHNGKAFAGQIFNKEELEAWVAEVGKDAGIPFDTSLLISISLPKGIHQEYRMFMVDGIATSCSMYKSNDRSRLKRCWDRRIFEFCEIIDRVWRPAGVYALDVCTTHDKKLYVVEVNDFSSSGFYAHDIPLIVQRVSEHRLKKWRADYE
jgi:hypothetical protein